MQAPVGKFDNKKSEAGMKNNMNDREEKIDTGMAQLTLFLMQGKQRNSPLQDPEKK